MKERIVKEVARYGDSHIEVLRTYIQLGRLQASLETYPDSISSLRKALHGCDKSLGRLHPTTIHACSSLATSLRLSGDHIAACRSQNRVVEALCCSFGEDHPGTYRAVATLALDYQSQGDMREACSLYRRALNGFDGTNHPNHGESLALSLTLGVLLGANFGKEKFKEAEVCIRRSHMGYMKSLGERHEKTLEAQRELLQLFAGQGTSGSKSHHENDVDD